MEVVLTLIVVLGAIVLVALAANTALIAIGGAVIAQLLVNALQGVKRKE